MNLLKSLAGAVLSGVVFTVTSTATRRILDNVFPLPTDEKQSKKTTPVPAEKDDLL